MMAYSKLLNKWYDSDNKNVLYISNTCQVYKYLNADEEVSNCLLDILYTGTRKDCLVFVFKKTPLMQELYQKWKNHELD